MPQSHAHSPCPHCGGPVSGPNARCERCDNGDLPPSGANQDLRLTPAQLQAAPRINPQQRPSGPWGRPPEGGDRPSLLPSAGQPETEGSASGGTAAENTAGGEVRRRTRSPEPTANSPEKADGRRESEEAVPETEGGAEDALEDDGDERPDASLRPPVLASEALRRDLFPDQPYASEVRVTVCLLGLLGSALTVWLLGWAMEGAPVLVSYLILAGLGAAPMGFMTRAAALVAFGSLGLSACCLLRLQWLSSAARDFGLLAVVLLLGAGLHYRAFHRASHLARALVSMGIAAGAVWLLTPGGILDFTVLDGEMREWLPEALKLPLGIVLMLSLLAFMDGRTTGGCNVWAGMLWLWFAAYNLSEVTAYVDPSTPLMDTLTDQPVRAMLALASSLISPALALSFAQALAGGLAKGGATHQSSTGRAFESAQ